MIEYLPLVLTGIGIIVAIVYYTLTLRNANRTRELQLRAQEQALETRQAQFFMQIYGRLHEKDHWEQYTEINSRTWDDIDDWWEKYGEKNNQAMAAFASVGSYFEGIGVLIKENLVDMRLVAELMSGPIISFWEMHAPIIDELRVVMNEPRMLIETEFLYNELVKYIDEHPEFKT
jgi:hypothetical protein